MTPTQIKQALSIRMLRAEKAERALRAARNAEMQATQAVQGIEKQLADFDDSFDARLEAFYAHASGGTRPESLHGARSFHADLAGQRGQIEALLPQAWQVVEVTRAQVAQARQVWATASAAVDSLQSIHKDVLRRVAREEDRIAEQDSDELSVYRSYRTAG